MPWTIPDKGEGQDNRQSILFQEDLEVLVAGIRGIDCVLSGCAVTAQGSPDMTVAVAKGGVLTNGVIKPVTAGNVTITTANSTNPRIDLIVVDSTGAKQCRAGTAAAAPQPPARTANDVVLAQIWVPASDTTISSAQIVDRRMVQDQGPITIAKTSTPVTFNNNNSIQTYFTVTLPSGLFSTGKSLRVRCGGTMLINSGTPTVTLTIAYGGSNLFADTSGTWTASAQRKPWQLDLVLSAQSLTVQNLTGIAALPVIGALTGPTTGQGDAWSTGQCDNPIAGAGTVDSDAADRAFDVKWTMSVANASDEISMTWATAELV